MIKQQKKQGRFEIAEEVAGDEFAAKRAQPAMPDAELISSR